jgi:hypothetical protein
MVTNMMIEFAGFELCADWYLRQMPNVILEKIVFLVAVDGHIESSVRLNTGPNKKGMSSWGVVGPRVGMGRSGVGWIKPAGPP